MKSTCSKCWTAAGETCKVDLVSFPQCITLREKNLCYPNSLKKVVVKTSISAHHLFRLIKNMQVDPHVSSSYQDIYPPKQSLPGRQSRESLASALPLESVSSDRRHQQLGDACRALWGDYPGICALSTSLRDSYACWFKACWSERRSFSNML